MLLSGGIDSATALYLTKRNRPTRALTFEYAGIATRELESARAAGARARIIEHKFVRLPDLREAGEIKGFDHRGHPSTYIPLRNSIFYSFAASYAEETGATAIVGGHNKDDEKVFEDVSPEFFSLFQRSLWAGSLALRRNKVRIFRPLRQKKKSEVVRLAASLGVPLEVTWSCNRAGKEHCWKCEGCRSRIEAFREAGVPDPLRFAQGEKVT